MTRLKEAIKEHNRMIVEAMGTMRRNNLTPQEEYDNTQLAILDVIQALTGVVPPDEVISAIGDAKSPNAVSRALRHRLSPKYFT